MIDTLTPDSAPAMPPPAIPPTEGQKLLLCYIHGYQIAHDGISPSLADCVAALGASKTTVHHLLVGLERRGLIRRMTGQARAIEVLQPPAIPMIGDQPLFFYPPLDLRSEA